MRVAVVVGVLTLIEALGLLAFGWRRFGLSSDAGLLQTFTFQTLFFALSSLVSMRERRSFWRSRPSAALGGSLGAAAAVVGGIIGLHGVAELAPLPFAESALIFGYAAICSLGPNDLVKAILCARVLRAPRSEETEMRKKGRRTLLEHPS